jgi:hypothetical protein
MASTIRGKTRAGFKAKIIATHKHKAQPWRKAHTARDKER